MSRKDFTGIELEHAVVDCYHRIHARKGIFKYRGDAIDIRLKIAAKFGKPFYTINTILAFNGIDN